jgi:hypothetical protein
MVADKIAARQLFRRRPRQRLHQTGAERRESVNVNKVHKKRSRANKRKRSKLNKRYSLKNSAPRTA